MWVYWGVYIYIYMCILFLDREIERNIGERERFDKVYWWDGG